MEMTSSEIGGSDSERAMQAEIARRRDADAVEPAGAHAEETDGPARRFSSRSTPAERDRLVQEVRNIDFPVGLRGYERGAVDHYVEKVSRLIAELEMYSSPESAVRHALDEVNEETRSLLEGARKTSEEITARSRSKADDRLQQAEREARELREAAQHEAEEMRELASREAQEVRDGAQQESAALRETATREAGDLREAAQNESTALRDTAAREVAELREAAQRETQELRSAAQQESDQVRGTARKSADAMLASAEARVRDLSESAETIWRERRRLVDDVRAVGEQLVAIGEAEARRFTRAADSAPLAGEAPSPSAKGKSNGDASADPGHVTAAG
jgi:DivIVA domain-containing protein